MKFNTQYNRSNVSQPSRPFFESDKDDLLEIGTYLPKHKKIEAFILGGKVLESARSNIEYFDFDEKTTDEQEDAFDDPTRRRGYDMADAHQESLAAQARLDEQLKAAKVKADALKKAAEEKVKAEQAELQAFRDEKARKEKESS